MISGFIQTRQTVISTLISTIQKEIIPSKYIHLIGQKVFEKENTRSATISLPNLQKGTYWSNNKRFKTTSKKIESTKF